MNINKVIIWGHELHDHTHSYIHNGFYRAFQHLGYKTLWISKPDETIDFNNTLFLTHGLVSRNIPINDTSIYLCHNVDMITLYNNRVLPEKHELVSNNNGIGIKKENIVRFQVYTKESIEKGIRDEEKKYHYYSSPPDPCIFFPWATDLLPHEVDINIENLPNIKSNNEIHLVGSMTKPWNLLYQESVKAGIPFYQHGAQFNVKSPKNRSIQDNVALIQRSIVAPAVQSEWQLVNGYIPCRIFKNISYGKMGVTNSATVNDLFDGRLIYSENTEELLQMGLAFEQNPNKNLIVRELMEYVRDNHTYINRIQTIMEYLEKHLQLQIPKKESKQKSLKLLHISFHKGCNNEINYVFTKLGHTVEEMRFDDGETKDDEIYRITKDRAQKSWEKYKDYYDSFDGIITSDTCPTSRPFLQNNWSKLLIIWVCNRFDYAVEGDQTFYDLLRSIPNRKNVFICGNTAIENVYSKQLRNVDITDFVMKPLGKNIVSQGLFKTYKEGEEEKFFVPVYENETKYTNLSAKLNEFGIKNNNGERFKDHISELLEYKGIVCLPYAWSTITFFEVMQLGLIYFVPSVSFLIELSKTRQPDSRQGFCRAPGRGRSPGLGRPKNSWVRGKTPGLGPTKLNRPGALCFWFQPPFNRDPQLLKAAEWYCDDHKDLLVYFDSWQDLQEKIKTTDYEKQTQKILEYAKKHEEITLAKWNSILKDYQRKITKEKICSS